jgi:hypothetical protein
MPRKSREQETKRDRDRLNDVLEANHIVPCTHPDCDPRQPSCASNAIYLRAKAAVTAAFRLGKFGPAGEVDADES